MSQIPTFTSRVPIPDATVDPFSALASGPAVGQALGQGLGDLGRAGIELVQSIKKSSDLRNSIEAEVMVSDRLAQLVSDSESDLESDPMVAHETFINSANELRNSLSTNLPEASRLRLGLQINNGVRSSLRIALGKTSRFNFDTHEKRIRNIEIGTDLSQIVGDIEGDAALSPSQKNNLLIEVREAASQRFSLSINGILDISDLGDDETKINVGKQIDSLITLAKKDGLDDPEIQEMVTAAIVGSANRNLDHNTLDAFETVKVEGGVLGQTQDARNARDTASYTISQRILARDNRDLKQEAELRRVRTNAITSAAISDMVENPDANITPHIKRLNRIDPRRVGPLLELQNKFQESDIDEDVDAVNALYADMLNNPLAFDTHRIVSAANAGLIRPKSIPKMLNDLEGFRDRILNDPILSDSVFKADLDRIVRAIQGSELDLSFFGERSAKAGEARRLTLQAALDWRQANPKGSITDFRNAMTTVTDNLLKKFNPDMSFRPERGNAGGGQSTDGFKPGKILKR